jgi:predicted acylesterase/phospholipase RssA
MREELMKFCVTDITFKKLYDTTGIKFHIPAYSIEKCMNIYFSVDSHPYMSVIDAVCASISIPLIFPPYNGYIDGSLVEEIPWVPFASKTNEDVLAVRISGESKIIDEKSFVNYITSLMNIVYSMRDKNIKIRTVIVNTGDLNIYNFKLDHHTKMKLFIAGYST